MLIIPLEKTLDWRRPPLVTLVLLAVNCWTFFFLQYDDDGFLEQAVSFHSDSGLAEIEFPRYLADLESRGELERVAQWRQVEHDYPADQAHAIRLMEVESDESFMQRLHAHQVINDGDPEFPAWMAARDEFESLLGRSSILGYGFTPIEHRPVTFFTYMYLHGAFAHLAGNMIFLFLIGFALEAALGSLGYLVCYLVAGLGSVVFFWAVYPGSTVPLVGASGAIAGLMGMYAFIFGKRQIKFFYSLLFYFDYVKAPAIIMLPLWLANELYQLMWGGISNVAYVAHLGGLLIGGGLGMVAKALPGRIDTDYLDASTRAEERTLRFEEGIQLLGSLEIERARALFRGLREDYPDDDEVLLQLYNAEKFNPASDAYHRTARDILSLPGNEPGIIKCIHETFCDYLSTTGGRIRIESSTLVQLAIRFTRTGHLESAERIICTLLRRRSDTPGLDGALLLLAKGWQHAHNDDKHKRYLGELSRHFPRSEAAAGVRRALAQGDPN